MECRICHESAGRMRVHFNQVRMSDAQADTLAYYLNHQSGVIEATVSERTCNAVIRYDGSRDALIEALAEFDYEQAPAPEHSSGREIMRAYEERLIFHTLRRAALKLFLPVNVQNLFTSVRAVKYIVPGIRALAAGKINVSVLDAPSILVSLVTGDYEHIRIDDVSAWNQ